MLLFTCSKCGGQDDGIGHFRFVVVAVLPPSASISALQGLLALEVTLNLNRFDNKQHCQEQNGRPETLSGPLAF